MEIAPIAGIRSASLISPPRALDAAARQFEIEAAARAGDEAETPQRQAPDRGLEDEETDVSEEYEDSSGRGVQIDVVA